MDTRRVGGPIRSHFTCLTAKYYYIQEYFYTPECSISHHSDEGDREQPSTNCVSNSPLCRVEESLSWGSSGSVVQWVRPLGHQPLGHRVHAPINTSRMLPCGRQRRLLGGVGLRRWWTAADEGHGIHVGCPSAMADACHVH